MSYLKILTLALRYDDLNLSAQVMDLTGVDSGDLITEMIEAGDEPDGTSYFIRKLGGDYQLNLTLDDSFQGCVKVANVDTGRSYGEVAINLPLLTTEQVETLNLAAERLVAVPGAPETPVFIIPEPDTPGLVNVLCRAGDFGTPRNGTAFTFRLTSKQAFIGEEFQVARQREKKTIDGSCLVPILPSAALTANGFNPATYDVLVNKNKVGTVTVPETGGLLKMVNGALVIEEAV